METRKKLVRWVVVLSCLYVIRDDLRSVGVSNTPTASCSSPSLRRRIHQPDVQVIFTDFFHRIGAFPRFSVCRFEPRNSHKPERNFQGRQHREC